MKHATNADFWACYVALPADAQRSADKAFKLLKKNPRHPSLRFKKIDEYWSVRATRNLRALATESSDGLIWFWIGTHAEYERLIG